MLMREMKWTWDELCATPLYVQMYTWDFLQRIFEKEADDIKQANKPKK